MAFTCSIPPLAISDFVDRARGSDTRKVSPFLKERDVKAGASIESAAMFAQARIGVFRSLRWINTEVDRTGLGDAQFDLTFCVDVVQTKLELPRDSSELIFCFVGLLP